MNYLSISQWQALAQSDPTAWTAHLKAALQACRERTGQAVISADCGAKCPDKLPVSGPLASVPYGLKDLFDFMGLPTHCSSRLPDLLETPAVADSALVQHLHALGAVCAAKTQMNEFAYGLSGENPHYGNCPHPQHAECLSGGSSSGSAHIVGGGYLPLAFGTDTGGSIRVPAAWCGLYGLRCQPRYYMDGCFPLAESFDAVGWFTRTREDMARSVAAWFGASNPPRPNLRGTALIPRDLLEPATFQCVSAAVRKLGLASEGATDALESWLPRCNEAFNVLQSREAYAIHRTRLEAHSALYDPAVKARILRGRDWPAEAIEAAESMRQNLSDWMDAYFESFDYLVMPACPRPCVSLRATTPALRERILRLTGPASLASKPALSVPLRLEDGRTVGLQIIFNRLEAETILGLLERCAPD